MASAATVNSPATTNVIRMPPATASGRAAAMSNQTWQEGYEGGANDFEGVIYTRYPELSRIRQRLIRSGATSAMTVVLLAVWNSA